METDDSYYSGYACKWRHMALLRVEVHADGDTG